MIDPSNPNGMPMMVCFCFGFRDRIRVDSYYLRFPPRLMREAEQGELGQSWVSSAVECCWTLEGAFYIKLSGEHYA